ncbi:acyltransferase family protein [Jiella sp. M17.18]
MGPQNLIADDRDMAIQWLRALAAIEVMVWHSDLLTKKFSEFSIQTSSYSFFGGIGVEVFFVVSGFLMALITAGNPAPGRFVRGRITRIYPLYWFFTSLVVLAAWLNPAWTLGQRLGRSSILESYLIIPQSHFPTLMVGWTLEYEVLFYAVVALALVVAAGWRETAWRGWVAPVLAACALVGALIPTDLLDHPMLDHLLSPYMLAFGFGWFLKARFGLSQPKRLLNAGTIGFAAGLSLALARGHDHDLVVRIAIASALVASAGSLRPILTRSGALGRAVAYVGEASYSVYLSHWFVLSMLGKVLGHLGLPPSADLPVRIVGCLCAIGVGTAFFTFVEWPLDRKFRRRRSGEIQRPAWKGTAGPAAELPIRPEPALALEPAERS